MTDLIKQARELCEGATDGPWIALNDTWNRTVYSTLEDGCRNKAIVKIEYADGDEGLYNGKLIAASRTLVPALADALEKAQGEIERLKSRNEELECAYSAYDGSALERADKHIELQEAAIHDLKVRAEKVEAERNKAVEDINHIANKIATCNEFLSGGVDKVSSLKLGRCDVCEGVCHESCKFEYRGTEDAK